MSKIYEALRRAELDRAAAENNGQVQTEETGGEALPESHLESYWPPTPVEPAANFTPSSAPIRDVGEFAPYAPSSSSPGFGDVAQRVWTPSFAQLPAVLERGGAVEQFRSLRSRLYEDRKASQMRSILIGSGMPQEGKSFVAVNLAITLCRHKNSRVLLIDGDMRRSTLDKVLGCSAEPGLADYLAGAATMQQIMQRAAPFADLDAEAATAFLNLTFIPGGKSGENAADLSGSRKFGELMAAANNAFDWIILDSSPVNLVADSVNLARACDAVLLVVRGGATKYEAAQRAQGSFRASRILGVVLNAVEETPEVYGYYGYDEEAK